MKNLMKVTFIVAFVVALLGVASAQKADAVSISGTIGFGGSVTPIDSFSTPQADYSTATGLEFGSTLVISSTGDFLSNSIGFGDIATYTDFQFNPLNPDPVSLWTVIDGSVTASFSMDSVVITNQNAGELNLVGSGTMSLTDFDDTPYIWVLSADTVASTFSFSATTAAAVPEPGTIALLGMGLVGLVGAGARRKARS